MARDSDFSSLRLSARLEGIAHLLRDRTLAVPPYQRSYSWTADEVSEFWADLKAALTLPEPEYFLGTIVVSGAKISRGVVIDGQQRLATVTMLLAAIRNYFLHVEDENRATVIERDYVAARSLRSAELEPRLKLNIEDADYFRDIVVSRPHAAPRDAVFESNRRVKDAFDLLTILVESEVSDAGPHWAEQLFRWVEFLDRGVLVIAVDVPTDTDAFLIFETLNDRGLPLTIADLLKNYLLGLSGSALSEVQAAWAAATRTVEDAADEAMIITYLRHYWSSIHGATRERDLYRMIRRAIRSQDQAVSLADHLERQAVHYAALIRSDSDFWTRLGPGTVPIVETLLRFRLEQFRPLVLSALDHFDDGLIVELLHSLINWSVRGLVVGGIGGGTNERYYSEAAVAIRNGRAADAQAVFDLVIPIVPSDEVFRSSMEEERETRAWLARYYLLALENSVSNAPHPAVVSESLDGQYGLGYLLPRDAKVAEWASFTADDIGRWVHRLGNLVLIEKEYVREFNRLDWPFER